MYANSFSQPIRSFQHAMASCISGGAESDRMSLCDFEQISRIPVVKSSTGVPLAPLDSLRSLVAG
jgi:hypothetical protein